MIRLTEKTRARLMMIHGYAMLALGLALFYVRATMTNLLFDVLGGAFALLLVAASLLFIASIDWICAAGLGSRQVQSLRGLLLLSTAVAACSVLVIEYPGLSIKMLCYVIAVYAFALSVGKMHLAKSWTGNIRERAAMYLLAGIALAFSACLVGVAGEDDRESLAVIAGYSVFMGLQMLLTMYLLQKQALKSMNPAHT